MIIYVKGSLFKSPAKVLVNTVNTVGVMGKGIAKTFKEIYPGMFSEYQKLCEKDQLQIGKLWLYKTNHKWILNFPTKKHWRQPSKAEYIEEGLKKFVSTCSTLGISSSSIAFPQLGCGNGQLDWEKVVKPLMTKYLEKLPMVIFIYEYGRDSFVPEHEDVEAMREWLRSEPSSLGFVEVWEDLRKLIGSGLNLSAWDGTTNFKVLLTTQSEPGFQIQVESMNIWEHLTSVIANLVPFVSYKWRLRIAGPKTIFVPKEAMLDLWQEIRHYGFCVPSMMPAGLDCLAPYILALLANLKYMKEPVVLATLEEEKAGIREKGLQLYIPPVAKLMRASEVTYMVQSA